MTPLEAKQYLDSFINYEIYSPKINPQRSFKLDRVKKLFNSLGNPQKKIKSIHIAGTKGKGSTCAFTSSILKRAGYKVGLYTSPHLCDFKERIRILDPTQGSENSADTFWGKIKDKQLANILEKIKDVLETLRVDPKLGRLSYFEVLTAVAVYHFVQSKVDFAVLETGLGGRLDATNSIDSLVGAITPISLEHTKYLGPTISAIAAEKAAIIKNKNQSAVIAPQMLAAQAIIKKRCEQYQAKTLWIGKNIQYKCVDRNLDGQIFHLKSSKNDYRYLKTKLLGEHQIVNAATALGIVESLCALGFAISEDAVHEGIVRAVWPGRFEILKKDPYIILDGAHNPASAQALAKTIQEFFPKEKVTLILGVSDDKDKLGIARALQKIAKKIIFTKADHPRASWLSEEESQDLFPGKEILRTENMRQALEAVLRTIAKEEIILITGSLFVVGEARGYLTDKTFAFER